MDNARIERAPYTGTMIDDMIKRVEAVVSPQKRQAPCPHCGGDGGFRVTHDMAMDAGDQSMASAFWGCSHCNGDGWIEVEL